MVAAGVIPPEAIVSSDRLRGILTGNESCMTVHMETFGIAHTIAKTRLKYGQDVYFDATNLLAKDLKQVIRLAPEGTRVIVAISDTDHEISLERNRRRERNVPEDVMQKFIQRQKSLDMKPILEEFPEVEVFTLSELTDVMSDIQFDQLFPPDTDPLPEPLRSVLTGDQTSDASVPPTASTEAQRAP